MPHILCQPSSIVFALLAAIVSPDTQTAAHGRLTVGIDFDWLESRILDYRLNAEEHDALAAAIVAQQFGKGERIIEQAQPGGMLYILFDGTAEIDYETNGERVHIANARQGALFGEMTFLTGEPASANVTATTACNVYKISRDGFSKLMEQNQNMVFSLFAYMLVYSSRVIRKMNEEHIAMLHYITGRRA
jgi:CRP-like cAMP-binding protein